MLRKDNSTKAAIGIFVLATVVLVGAISIVKPGHVGTKGGHIVKPGH